jgi:hypothetical protein
MQNFSNTNSELGCHTSSKVFSLKHTVRLSNKQGSTLTLEMTKASR